MAEQVKLLTVLFPLLVVGTVLPAFGTPSYYVFASGQAGAQGGAGFPQTTFNSGTLQQTSYLVSPISLVSDGTTGAGALDDASASLNGSITPGQLHGVVNASAGQGAPGYNAQGVASLTEFWDDTLTVGGLPNGTPVDIIVTFTFHAIVGLTGVPSGTLYNEAQGNSNLSVADLTTGVHADIPTFYSYDTNPIDTQTATAVLHTAAGRQLQLFQQMELVASASGDITQVPLIIASVDAGDTSSGYLDVLTPGATFTADSGASYSSQAAPEPSSSFVLVAGLLVYGVLRRRSRKSHRV